ncbi:MAG: phosphoribosyltransferase family protein [Patescibacteria group bacterium]
MSLIRSLYTIILEALFPLSGPEQELFSYSPEEALQKLPPAPATPIPATSLFAYKDERVAKLIWNIKYKKNALAVKIAGYALCRTLLARPGLASTQPNKTIVLIPIPITPRRRRERGFNQCELLVDEIHRLDMNSQFIIEKNVLIRTQHTSRHTLKGREDRLADAKGIFATVPEVARQYDPTSTRFIIIDDVITTGSTLKEAMETLKNATGAEVKGMSVAH